MNEKSLKLLIENGAIKKALVKSTGAKFHIEFRTSKDTVIAETTQGMIKTWSSIDSAASWLKKIGMGTAEVDFAQWHPKQKSF